MGQEKRNMQFYMAPMEGLTGYVYRNAYQKHYGNIDRYFTPFITNKKLNHKELNDILPEHNQGMEVIPQILTNRAEDFLFIAEELREYGYGIVNLNLGCPSGTVAAKNRGAGFLALPRELDCFLGEIFAECPLKISIKTRIGKESPTEWERLLAIYEKYPLEELIIHPRVQKDYYKNSVNLEAFGLAMEKSSHSICYNGDICTVADYGRIKAAFPAVEKVMLGRGLLADPQLVREIKAKTKKGVSRMAVLPEETKENEISERADGGAKVRRDMPSPNEAAEEKERLRAFHDDILYGYQHIMSGDRNTLFKMKELWVYLGGRFANSEKYLKKIRKADRIQEYEIYVDALFREQELIQRTEQEY